MRAVEFIFAELVIESSRSCTWKWNFRFELHDTRSLSLYCALFRGGNSSCFHLDGNELSCCPAIILHFCFQPRSLWHCAHTASVFIAVSRFIVDFLRHLKWKIVAADNFEGEKKAAASIQVSLYYRRSFFKESNKSESGGALLETQFLIKPPRAWCR